MSKTKIISKMVYCKMISEGPWLNSQQVSVNCKNIQI